MRTGPLIVLSVAAHVGGFFAISQKAKQVEHRQTLIAMVEQKKKVEEEKKKPPPKPIEAPKEILKPNRPAEAPPPAAPPEPTNAKPSAAMEAMPDFGLNLGGGGGGDGPGIAVPRGNPGGAQGPKPPAPKEKVLSPAGAAPKSADPDMAAEIAAWKPKPVTRIKPVFPDEARSAEIEGTVSIEARIDCTGKVIDAKVLKGLGHGLDESALVAIRKTEFEPAPRCAKGFEKTVKINYAFRLGD